MMFLVMDTRRTWSRDLRGWSCSWGDLGLYSFSLHEGTKGSPEPESSSQEPHLGGGTMDLELPLGPGQVKEQDVYHRGFASLRYFLTF